MPVVAARRVVGEAAALENLTRFPNEVSNSFRGVSPHKTSAGGKREGDGD